MRECLRSDVTLTEDWHSRQLPTAVLLKFDRNSSFETEVDGLPTTSANTPRLTRAVLLSSSKRVCVGDGTAGALLWWLTSCAFRRSAAARCSILRSFSRRRSVWMKCVFTRIGLNSVRPHGLRQHSRAQPQGKRSRSTYTLNYRLAKCPAIVRKH